MTEFILNFFSKNNLLTFSRCIDILELSERMDLLKFHYHTLKLYGSVCALGNNRVAHALCSHVDESQLFYAIENTYLPGPMRSGFYDLLISMHLESAKRNRLGTNKEFIVPMTDETRSITLYSGKSHALPGVGLTTCLRPKLHFSSIGFVGTDQDIYTLSPVIPLQVSWYRYYTYLRCSRDANNFKCLVFPGVKDQGPKHADWGGARRWSSHEGSCGR